MRKGLILGALSVIFVCAGLLAVPRVSEKKPSLKAAAPVLKCERMIVEGTPWDRDLNRERNGMHPGNRLQVNFQEIRFTF